MEKFTASQGRVFYFKEVSIVFNETLAAIGELDRGAMEAAQARLDSLIKPPGSLGVLEELAVRLAGITGNPRPVIRDKAVIVMAGDHGVVSEGVSIAPQDITWQMLPAFIDGVSGIGVLARHAGARVVVVDVGVAVPVDTPGVLSKKVRPGAGNIAVGPAMTREEAVKAIEAGIEVAGAEIDRGADLLALGDMGIGNTTPSSAILAVFGSYTGKEVAGRGTLVNDEILNKKINVIDRALLVNRPDPNDGLDVLSKVGGLE
ncbi:MAG: nicotinate-nucleotide--dimethylbenzimidazole phosphoribosyltransferase, partial [Peptococcaceae bacterium]|nr:nicotinate-nucleotide--dimethylbenzimidazole phosphoribosyltransferase [Peptococcaceae bacterium]